ncbi:hypothetical protein JCM18382A_50300 [Bradyrhizobium sp. 17-4]
MLLTSPVRSANSAKVKALSPRRKAVKTASARSAADTPLSAGGFFSLCLAISNPHLCFSYVILVPV